MDRIGIWAALGAVALSACGPVRVAGEVDGEGVGGARDAIWDTLSFEFGPFSYEATAIILTDFPDACETFEGFYGAVLDEFGCDDLCEAYVGVAEEHGLRQDAYWSTLLVVNTSDGQDGTFTFGNDVGEGEFDASFNAYDAAPLYDPATCESVCEDGDLLAPEVDDAEDGELELEADEDLLRGTFGVSFGGEDGLEGRFVAEPCDMGEWFDL